MAVTTISGAYRSAIEYFKKQSKYDLNNSYKDWFQRTGKEAENRLFKLVESKERAKVLLPSISQSPKDPTKQASSEILNRRFKEQKEYAALLAEYTKSYIFVEKVRKDITKEESEYLLNLHYEKTSFSTIQRLTLKQLIPTLEVAVTATDHKFALVIRNIKNLNKIAQQKSSIQEKLIKVINTMTDKILTQKLKNRSTKEWIYGPGGIAFESAVRKLANGILEGKEINSIDASWRDFEKDVQVFYKNGDLSAQQVQALFGIKNTAMELKRVSLKENSVGAGIFSERTIEIVLEKIRDACALGIEGEGEQVLKDLFSGKDEAKRMQMLSEVEKKLLQEEADKIVEKALGIKVK